MKTDQEMPFRIVRLITSIRLAIREKINARLANLDLTVAQWAVVVYLAEGRADTLSGLSRLMENDRGAMSRMLDRLERKGLVQRSIHPDDARAVHVALTGPGRRLYPAIRPLVAEVLAGMNDGLQPDELQQLETLLQRMQANAGPAPSAGS